MDLPSLISYYQPSTWLEGGKKYSSPISFGRPTYFIILSFLLLLPEIIKGLLWNKEIKTNPKSVNEPWIDQEEIWDNHELIKIKISNCTILTMKS